MVKFIVYNIFLSVNPLAPMVLLSGLVLKENASVVGSMKNLDAKCEVQGSLALFAPNAKNQTILSSIVFTMAQYTVPLE